MVRPLVFYQVEGGYKPIVCQEELSACVNETGVEPDVVRYLCLEALGVVLAIQLYVIHICSFFLVYAC